MTREEVRKLLGGYATGTLTEAEQAVLFAMALEDQELFDELGREQALRDLMRDPAAKAEMLAALDAAGERRAWWQMRPLMAGLAMAGVAVLGVVVWQQTQTRPRLLAQMDRIETSAPSSGVAPVPQAASPPVGETRAREIDRRQTPAARGNEASDLRPREEPLEKQAAAKEKDATLPSAPAPVPAAAPPPPPARQALGAVKDEVVSGNRVASSGLVAGTGGGGGGGARDAPKIMAEASQPQAKPAAATMAAGALTDKKAAVEAVRYSILRSDGEAEPGTVLRAGETVRLRIVSDGSGFVTVSEGERIVASGMAGPGRPFETPPLLFQGAGSRSLQVQVSPPAVPSAFAARSDTAAPPPHLSVTLTYR